MITKLPRRHGSLRALLDYLESKPRARLLATNLETDRVPELARRLEDLSRLHRPGMENFVKHMVLAFAPGEEISRDELREITALYLEGMGYEAAPFAAYLHTDTPHPHIHIVTTPTTFEGERISESWDWPRSERLARHLEERFGLVRVPLSDQARRRAPSTAEVQLERWTGEASQRAFFQERVESAALASRTFIHFLDQLHAEGFEVRVTLDREGRPRGLSFGHGTTHFKASQLGRSFTGGRILMAYGLDYSPEREQGALRERNERKASVPAAAAPSPAEDAVEAPAPKPVPAAPVKLPMRYSYQLAGVDPAFLEPGGKRLDRLDLTWVRTGWKAATVEKSRTWLSENNAAMSVLFRPQVEHRSVLGFRNVTEDQLRSLRRSGLEPTWLVRVGDRFDLLIELEERLPAPDLGVLKARISEELGLENPTGVFRDAIRLHGHRHGGADSEPAVLLAQHAAATQLPERWRGVGRLGSEVEILDQRADRFWRDLDADEALKHPAGVPKPEMPPPGWEPAADLQTWIETRARIGGFPSLEALRDSDFSTQGLGEQASDLNRKLLGRLHGGETVYFERDETAQRLRVIEHELTSRRGRLYLDLEEELTPGLLGSEPDELDATLRRLQSQPTIQVVKDYHSRRKFESDRAKRHERRRQELLQIEGIQTRLDRQRYGASLLAWRDLGAFEAYDRLLRHETRVGLQLGEIEPLKAKSKAEAQTALDQLEPDGQRLREGLARDSYGELSAYAQHRRQTFLAEQELYRWELLDQLRDLRSRGLEVELGAGAYEKAHLRRVDEEREVLARLGSHSTAFSDPTRFDPSRLREIATEVASGDRSPRKLRELNGLILEIRTDQRLPAPVFDTPDEISKLLYRYHSLDKAVERSAEKVAAQSSPQDSHQMAVLFRDSSQLILVHRKLEAHQRSLLRIADPGPAPERVSQWAWNLAWLERAVQKGLSPTSAAAQLQNSWRGITTAAGLLSPWQVTHWSWRLGTMALRAGMRYAQRVLAQ